MKKLLLLALLILIYVNAFAADQQKVTIEADNVDSADNTTYHATGSVKVFQGDKTMLADEIYYYKDINYLEATGNVRMTDPQETVDCDKMEYDTERQTGVFYNADGFMEPYSWFKAKEAHKTGESSYFLSKAQYTTCSGKNPAWSFTASSADLNVGGYFSAYNVAGWAKSVPVFYTPYLIYPVKTERESGFLLPKLGVSSKLGAFIQPKFFYNMDVDKDFTFATLLSNKAKTVYAMESRFVPSTESNIYNYVEYTGENKQTPTDNAETGYKDKTAGRYVFYNRSDINFSDNLELKIKLDAVSDYSYLDDYKEYSLIDKLDNTDKNYQNNIDLLYYSKFSDITLRYSDNMSYTVASAYEKEHTYLKPSLIMQKDIASAPLNIRYYFSHDEVEHTQFDYLYSTKTQTYDDIKYSRDHINLLFYKPLPMYVGTLTPTIRLYYTKWYNIDSNYDYDKPTTQNVSGNTFLKVNDNSITRQLYTIGYTFDFKEIYKNYDGFKHSIYNSITYTETPTIDETNLFDYTYEDTLDYDRSYTYALKNYFTSKNWSLKIENSQPYSLARKDKRLDNLISKVDYAYTDLFGLHFEHDYEHYEKDTNFLNMSAGLKLKDITLTGGFTFDKDTSEDQNTSVRAGLVYSQPKYDLSYTRTSSGWNRKLSFKTNASIDDSFTVTFKSECWQMGLTYTRKTTIDNVAVSSDSTQEHIVLLTLGLRGLGKYSTSVYDTKITPDGAN